MNNLKLINKWGTQAEMPVMVPSMKDNVRVLIEDLRQYEEIDDETAQRVLDTLETDGPRAALEQVQGTFG